MAGSALVMCNWKPAFGVEAKPPSDLARELRLSERMDPCVILYAF